MAYTAMSASSAPAALYTGNVRSEAKTVVEAMELVGSSQDAPPKETGPPDARQVQGVAEDDGVGGMAYDNYLNMRAAQRAFAETDFFGTTDQTLLIGGGAVRNML